jgi:hypothetical protein
MVMVALFCTTWFAQAQARAGESPACSHTKATQVDARVDDLGTKRTCGAGLYVFGFGGAILGEECPVTRVFYPAHQVCNGEHADNVRCERDETIFAVKKSCSCGGLVIPFINTGIPTTCVCGDPTTGGSIEDFRTVNC